MDFYFSADLHKTSKYPLKLSAIPLLLITKKIGSSLNIEIIDISPVILIETIEEYFDQTKKAKEPLEKVTDSVKYDSEEISKHLEIKLYEEFREKDSYNWKCCSISWSAFFRFNSFLP